MDRKYQGRSAVRRTDLDAMSTGAMTTSRSAKRVVAWRHQGRTAGTRGQVIAIFAGAMLLFALTCAIVIDLSWYWTTNLRMQRAADAASLAGVVFLPGDPSGAYAAARAEATKNGFSDGVDGYTVTPVQDPVNDHRLRVTISGPVNTFFARVVGITSFPASRQAKADFVLPVPMGSPDNYYGVGFFERRVSTASPVDDNTGYNAASSAVSGGQWSNAGDADSEDDDYTTEDTNDHAQQWSNFGLQSEIDDDGTLVIDGIQVRLNDARLTGSGTSTSCRILVALSWNGGSSWSANVPSAALTTSDTDPVVGSNSDLSMWTPHTTWTRNDFANGNFRVRLTWQDGTAGCASSRSVQLDQLQVHVQFHTVTTSWNNETLNVYDPSSGTALASQGFWGAVFTSGGIRENGDRFAPAYLGGGTGAPSGNPNPDYDSGGYDYILELPGGSGQVRLFDPIFCATGDNGHGGLYGAGDHWTGRPSGAGVVIGPVSVTYRLYDAKGTPANPADDGAPVATLTYDPGSATLGDFSGNFGTPANSGLAGASDCSGHSAHNQWVTLGSGLGQSMYRLNVDTSSDSDNLAIGAENLFSIWVHSASAGARVYGAGRMAAYTNLDGGLQAFYFAQIEQQHAGKTMVIELFDPGEVSGNGYLRLQTPNGNAYDYATFSWTSDDGRSGTNVTQIQTSINGAAQFNNRLITIEVPLPPTYGSTGLNPPGDITDEPGWWRVEYNVSGGNDTTTWGVSIRGNPVHLVLP